jgi:hypothetical protein
VIDNRTQQQTTSSSSNQRSVTNTSRDTNQDRQQVLVLVLFSGYLPIHSFFFDITHPSHFDFLPIAI